MATQATKARENQGTTLHVPITADLRKKFDQMRLADRRQGTDFIRILIEDEWNRRNGNGQVKP